MRLLVKYETLALPRQWYVVRRFETSLFFIFLSRFCLSLVVLNRRGVTLGRTCVASLRGCLLPSPLPLLRFRFSSRTLGDALDDFCGRRLLRLPSSTAGSNRGDIRLNFLRPFDLPLLGWTLDGGLFLFLFLFLRYDLESQRWTRTSLYSPHSPKYQGTRCR